MPKTIVRKPFFNKNTGQGSVTIPKKEMKKIDSTLKFDENLFVEIKFLRKEK